MKREQIELPDERFILGINWGAIEEKGWFGAKGYLSVDLDLNLVVISASGKVLSEHNWKNKTTNMIRLSGDDTTGDIFINDGLDNEYAILDLSYLDETNRLLAFVNNFTVYVFGKLGHFDYRIYTGQPNHPEKVHYFSDLTKVKDFDRAFGIFPGTFQWQDEKMIYRPMEHCLTQQGERQQLKEALSILS